MTWVLSQGVKSSYLLGHFQLHLRHNSFKRSFYVFSLGSNQLLYHWVFWDPWVFCDPKVFLWSQTLSKVSKLSKASPSASIVYQLLVFIFWKYKKKCTNATLLSIHPLFSHQLSGKPTLKYYFFPSLLPPTQEIL